RGTLRKAVFILLFVGVLGMAFWFFFRFYIFPTASITKFQPSNIRFYDEATNPRFKSREYPARDYYLSTLEPDVFEEITCHSAASMTVSRNGDFRTKSVRIESVEFRVEHIPFVG